MTSAPCDAGQVLDFAHCYRAIAAKDGRFDGWFITAVTSTGIYCRPSCPARTPKGENVRFFPTAAAAQAAGFRACKRCRPDAAPGSPEWDTRADLVGRAMRLIADGVVEREGVGGLAARLGYSERHLHRCLLEAVGAGPLALARSQRAQTARVLLETSELGIGELALTAGFASIRQFNTTMRQVFDRTPRELRAGAGADGGAAGSEPPGGVTVRLSYRPPFDGGGLLAFLGARAVPGIEQALPGGYRRSLALPRGNGVAELAPRDGHVRATFWLEDLRDLGAAISRCRRLLDLDSDPQSILERLAGDPTIGTLVRGEPGRRVPGHTDGAELAIRAVLGQQVSVAGARTLAARLVASCGEPLAMPVGDVTHVFPAAAALAELDPAKLAMPRARGATLVGLAAAVARGELILDEGADRARSVAALLALPGVGPWTAGYIAMRALRDPDAFPAGDLGVRRALESLRPGVAGADLEACAEHWRPYRAYATQHLWASLAAPVSAPVRARAALGLAA
jgi:AraC family transcriptional regulator, regulatory protein of adaptative response / DNA-3-methyladenine glycosylase II